MLGIKYPIVIGTMMHISNAKFVAAASNAGCLGVLASAMFNTKQEFRDEIRRLQDLTDRPFAVNINLFPSLRPIDTKIYLEVLISERVKVVETSGHRAPDHLIQDIRREGLTLIHKCVGVRYAKKAQAIGADAVTVVGFENGGATGIQDITTLCLVPRVVDSLDIPVIAGGGIADGRGFLSMLILGAQGVIMGTPFLVAEECPIHSNLKEELISAEEVDTKIILRSIGNSHRVLSNELAKRILECEYRNADREEIISMISGDKTKRMYNEGILNSSVMSCGQSVGLVKSVRPLKDIVEKIIQQAHDIRLKLALS